MSIYIEEVLKHVNLPFDGSLHQYQDEDITKAAIYERFGFFLDLGLGKSVMAALTGGIKLLNGFERVIVLAPASLVHQWVEMLVKMNYAALWYKGTPAVRKGLHLDYDFIVMSYEIFQKDYDRFRDVTKTYFIVDEATILCNSQNILWKMLNGGIIKKKRKVPGSVKTSIEKIKFNQVMDQCCLLTATPINKPTDSYGLIKILSPDIYRNYTQFERCHVESHDIFGNPKAYKDLDILHENLLSAASMRSALDHLDLPEIVYNVIEYDLDPAHQALYNELVETRMIEMNDKIEVDAVTATSLYNWCQKLVLNPVEAGYKKDSAGIELLDTIVAGVKQVLIMNKYVMTNNQIMVRYKAGGVYGEISRSDQQKYVQQFQEGKLKVLTCNEKSGGVGLNLQCCRQVVLPELPLTPRGFRQAVGRVYRQGQKERVIVTIPVARHTIQMRLLKSIMAKDDISQEVVPTPSRLRDDLLGRVKK